MKRKSLYLIFTLLFSLALVAGCSNSDTTTTTPKTQPKKVDQTHTPAENVEKALDKAGDSASKALDGAGTSASGALDTAQEKTGEVLESAGQSIAETGRDLQEDAKN